MSYKNEDEMTKDERLNFIAHLIEESKELSEHIKSLENDRNKELHPLNVYECEATESFLHCHALTAASSEGYSKRMRENALRRYSAGLKFIEKIMQERLAEIESALERL